MEVGRTKTSFSARSVSYRSATPPVSYALLALVAIGASTATAQPGAALVQRLDSIAGAGVLETRSVGVVAAFVKGKDTLLLKAYGKADAEGDVPATVDTVFQIGSDTSPRTTWAEAPYRRAVSATRWGPPRIRELTHPRDPSDGTHASSEPPLIVMILTMMHCPDQRINRSTLYENKTWIGKFRKT